ncbi:MAG: DNRLRE domain-containing protein [Myxococcota bacterium]
MIRQTWWISILSSLSAAGLGACVDVSGAPPEPSRGDPIGVVSAALTASTSIQRGHGTVADTTLKAQEMRKSFGGDAKLVVSKKSEVLLRFDVSAIPPSAVINSATLTLYMHGHDDGDDDHDCDDDDGRDEDRRGFAAVPIQIQLATAPWVESKVTYASFAQAIDPAVAGLLLPAGRNTYKSVDLKATVQSWVGGTRANYGVVVRTTSRKRWSFASSENERQALRPSLTISYSTPDEHCRPNPCQNGGSCNNGWTGYTCSCPAGFTGARCETNIDDCAGDPCQHGGTCSDGVAGYTCSCAAGFGGPHCETNVDDCAPSPCQHGGVCTDGVAGYTCACAVGYTDADCGTLIDECASGPCQNGGTCTNGVGSYTCACPAGFSGANCETNVDDCAGAPCQNGGSCVDGVEAYSCNCAAGFTGARCESDIDDCASSPCLNGGACADGTASYSCTCPAGFAGANCETDIDDCASHPCLNGGVCVDGVASYACSCAAGFGGASCQTDLDDCAPNPCQNGGACNDGVDSHSCDCPFGFSGANCETPDASGCPSGTVDPPAAVVVASLGDVVAPGGYEYRAAPAATTASSPNECAAWSCGTGNGPAASAIDDLGTTGWNAGYWDLGGGYDLTLTFAAAQTLHGLHVIAEAVPTDVETYTVTLTTGTGAEIALAPVSASIFDRRTAGDQTGVDIGFSSAGYADIRSIRINVTAPFENPSLSSWIDVREVQLVQPVGCAL